MTLNLHRLKSVPLRLIPRTVESVQSRMSNVQRQMVSCTRMIRSTLATTLCMIVALTISPDLCVWRVWAQQETSTGQRNTTSSPAQKNTPPPVPQNLLKRTTTRRESLRLGYGGTVTIVGAPTGSITVEGWSKSEVEVVADMELNAPTEEDLNRLAVVNNVAVDSDTNHVRVLTTGTHDKVFMRRVAKNFP